MRHTDFHLGISLILALLMTACRPTAVPTLYPTVTPSRPAPTATIELMDVTASPTPHVTPTPTQVASPPLLNILAVSFINDHTGWLLGEACPAAETGCRNRVIVLRRSEDGGRTWLPLPAPPAYSPAATDHPNESVAGIFFSNETNGWLYGTASYYTRDGGMSWHATERPILALTKRDNRLWAAVATSDGWEIVTSDDEGGTWVNSPSQASWQGSNPQMTVLNASHAWVMANTDFTWHLWSTSDGGVSWKELPSAEQPYRAVRLLQVDHNGRLWLFSADQPAGGSQSKALHTSIDGGTSWQLVAGPPFDSRTPCNLPWSGELLTGTQLIASNGSAWFLALGRYTLIRSTNAGCDWSEAVPFDQANIGDATILGVTFADAQHGWAAANPNRLFITSDGGATWEMVTITQ